MVPIEDVELLAALEDKIDLEDAPAALQFDILRDSVDGEISSIVGLTLRFSGCAARRPLQPAV